MEPRSVAGQLLPQSESEVHVETHCVPPPVLAEVEVVVEFPPVELVVIGGVPVDEDVVDPEVAPPDPVVVPASNRL